MRHYAFEGQELTAQEIADSTGVDAKLIERFMKWPEPPRNREKLAEYVAVVNGEAIEAPQVKRRGRRKVQP